MPVNEKKQAGPAAEGVAVVYNSAKSRIDSSVVAVVPLPTLVFFAGASAACGIILAEPDPDHARNVTVAFRNLRTREVVASVGATVKKGENSVGIQVPQQ